MFKEIIDRTNQKRIESKSRWDNLDNDLCMLCGAHGPDKRSLFIDCLYDLQEAIAQFIDLHDCGESVSNRGYYLKICKSCRAALIGHLRVWGNERTALHDVSKDEDGDPIDEIEGLIPVRIDGGITYMTPDQYRQFRGDSI